MRGGAALGATKTMNDSGDHRVSLLDARDNRRWLIGVGVSVGFGLFGVVMALLSYSHRATAPSAVSAPAAHGPAANTPTRAPSERAPDSSARERRKSRRP